MVDKENKLLNTSDEGETKTPKNKKVLKIILIILGIIIAIPFLFFITCLALLSNASFQ